MVWGIRPERTLESAKTEREGKGFEGDGGTGNFLSV